MNRIGKLLAERNMSQKELAISLGIAQPSVSAWVNNKSDPTIVNAQRIANMFDVPMDYVLYMDYSQTDSPIIPQRTEFDPEPPKRSGLTDEDLQKIANLMQVGGETPKTIEARILSAGVDKMPAEERERALKVMQLVFAKYADYFDMKGKNDDT